MYGENRKPVALQCCTCQRWVAMYVDPEDIRRRDDGMLVQDAFADRDGKPYLSPRDRELWISGVCGNCWPLLCPEDPMAYD